MNPVFQGDVVATATLANPKTMQMDCKWFLATTTHAANSSVIACIPLLAVAQQAEGEEGDDAPSFAIKWNEATAVQASAVITTISAKKVALLNEGDIVRLTTTTLRLPRETVDDATHLAMNGSSQRLCRLLASELPQEHRQEQGQGGAPSNSSSKSSSTAQRVVTVQEFVKQRNIYRDQLLKRMAANKSVGDDEEHYVKSLRAVAEETVQRIGALVGDLDAQIKQEIEAAVSGANANNTAEKLHAKVTSSRASGATATAAAAASKDGALFKDASQIFNVAWELAGSLETTDKTPDILAWLVALPGRCKAAFSGEFVFKKESARTMLLKLRHMLRVMLEKDPKERKKMAWAQCKDTDLGAAGYSLWESTENPWLRDITKRRVPPQLVLNSIAAVFIYTVDAKYCNCTDMVGCSAKQDVKGDNHRCNAPKPTNNAVFGYNNQPWQATNWLLRVAHDVNQPLAVSTQAAKSLTVFAPFVHDLVLALTLLPQAAQVAFRGLGVPIADQFKLGTKVTLAPFTSTALDANVAKDFLGGGQGTFFLLRARTCADISAFSWYPTQREVLMLPFTELEVKQKTSRTLLQMLGCKYDIVTFVESNAHVDDAVEIREVYESSQKLQDIYGAFVERYIPGRVTVEGGAAAGAPAEGAAADDQRRIFEHMTAQLFGEQPQQRQVMLLGGGGSGKTSATVGCLSHFACQPNVIPLFVPLPSVASLHSPDALDQHVFQLLGVRRQARELLKSSGYKVVLILDSLDEIGARRVPIGLLDINPWCAQQHVILSCRPEYLTLNGVNPFGTVLHSEGSEDRVACMNLKHFTNEDITEFIRHAVAENATATSSGSKSDGEDSSKAAERIEAKVRALPDKALITLPCTLAIVVRVYLRFEHLLDEAIDAGHTIGRRHIMDAFLRGHLAEALEIPFAAAMAGIKEVAWTMLAEGSWQLPLRTVLSKFEGIPAPIVRHKLLPHIPRRVEDDNDDGCAFSFWHKVIPEWLCATVLIDAPERACRIRREFTNDGESLQTIMRALGEAMGTMPRSRINAAVDELYPVACRVERRTPLLTSVMHVLAAVEYAPSLQRELLLLCDRCQELINQIETPEGYAKIPPLPDDSDPNQPFTPDWLASMSRTPTMNAVPIGPSNANTLRMTLLHFLSVFDPRLPDIERRKISSMRPDQESSRAFNGKLVRFDATADADVVRSFASKGVLPATGALHCFAGFIFTVPSNADCDCRSVSQHASGVKGHKTRKGHKIEQDNNAAYGYNSSLATVGNWVDRVSADGNDGVHATAAAMRDRLLPYLNGVNSALPRLPISSRLAYRAIGVNIKLGPQWYCAPLSSASVRSHEALSFTNPDKPGTFKLMASESGADLTSLSFYPEQSEALLPRSTVYDVIWKCSEDSRMYFDWKTQFALMKDASMQMTTELATLMWRSFTSILKTVAKKLLQRATLPLRRIFQDGAVKKKGAMASGGDAKGLLGWFQNGTRNCLVSCTSEEARAALSIDFLSAMGQQNDVVPQYLHYADHCGSTPQGVLGMLERFAYTPYESMTYVVVLQHFTGNVGDFLNEAGKWNAAAQFVFMTQDLDGGGGASVAASATSDICDAYEAHGEIQASS